MIASQWATRLASLSPQDMRVLEKVYGSKGGMVQERVGLLRVVLAHFMERFGDGEVRIFRSPGRVNLRGMHVDTHGGFLNLMTHQRETVVAASAIDEDTITVANTDPQFSEVSFRCEESANHPSFQGPWERFITHPDIQRDVNARLGSWDNYVQGSALSVQHRFPETPLKGLNAVVGSDLPWGAALSSSAALCVALLQATLGCNGLALDQREMILAEQDAEWYTGARTGTSDPGAMVLGGLNELVNVVLDPECLEVDAAKRSIFPDALGLLVVDSFTKRRLSGDEFLEYVRNRFAYSIALDICRQEMGHLGVPSEFLTELTRFNSLSQERIEAFDGIDSVYTLLKQIPVALPFEDLRNRYASANLGAAYARYFGTMPEAIQGHDIALRGPLLFGMAESERARIFQDTLEQGAYEKAGRLMSIGHHGDRRVLPDGSPFVCDVSDEVMDTLAADRTPLWQCPGMYGASSPVLDALVDTARDAGALGASLMGAGLAGSVLALCKTEDLDSVAQALREKLSSEAYSQLAKRKQPLTDQDLENAVVVNCAPSCAGELLLGE